MTSARPLSLLSAEFAKIFCVQGRWQERKAVDVVEKMDMDMDTHIHTNIHMEILLAADTTD